MELTQEEEGIPTTHIKGFSIANCPCRIFRRYSMQGINKIAWIDPLEILLHAHGIGIAILRQTAATEGVHVAVRAHYSPEHSAPANSRWFFLYTIRITNQGDEQVQLLSRHWIIVDGTGKSQEVHGPGVVGEQPILAPGQSFEYTSGCPLPTPFGSMTGSYEMVRGEGERFQAAIALFELKQPFALH